MVQKNDGLANERLQEKYYADVWSGRGGIPDARDDCKNLRKLPGKEEDCCVQKEDKTWKREEKKTENCMC
jgi:hypothetical protein